MIAYSSARTAITVRAKYRHLDRLPLECTFSFAPRRTDRDCTALRFVPLLPRSMSAHASRIWYAGAYVGMLSGNGASASPAQMP